jgi:toxin ParE1/3/4
MRRFHLSELAESDLADIRRYIERDKPAAAERQIAKFFQMFRTLAKNADLGERRPDYGPGIRTFSVGTYVIAYRPYAEGVEIVRVVSGYRDLDAMFAGH